jgi:hypothetical protein
MSTQGQDHHKADHQAERQADGAKRARKLLRRLRRIVERIRWTYTSAEELQPVLGPICAAFDAPERLLDLVGPARSNGKRRPAPVLDQGVVQQELLKLRQALLVVGKWEGQVETGQIADALYAVDGVDEWSVGLPRMVSAGPALAQKHTYQVRTRANCGHGVSATARAVADKIRP